MKLDLAQFVAAWERDRIIPHCAVCSRPCCKLDDVVLDLDWPRARALYQITTSRRAFTRALPPHIKEHQGRFYAHGAPCPAYVDKKCAVYGTAVKPPGCSDFPIYVDGDAVTLDRRCEAVDVDAVVAALATRAKVTKSEDPQFPVLVTLDVKP